MWNNICRLCAKHSDFEIPIFEGDGLKYKLADIIVKYFPFQVLPNDGFPQNCCHNCASLVMAWNDMMTRSEIANRKFHDIRTDTFSKHVKLDEKLQQVNKRKEILRKAVLKVNDEQKETINVVDISEIEVNHEERTIKDLQSGTNEVKNNSDNSIANQTHDDDLNNKPGKEEIVGLQPYKLQYPLKYLTINNQQYLRTRVFGFVATPVSKVGLNVGDLYFTCCLCKVILKSEDVINHSKSHYPLKNTDSCQLCHFGFISQECLFRHLKKHIVLIDELCENNSKCSESCDDDCKHSCHGNESPKGCVGKREYYTNVCEFCGKAFKKEKLFLKHLHRFHESPYPLRCDLCKKGFAYKGSLKRHNCLVVKSEKKMGWHECKCKRIFLFVDQYLNHVETCDKVKHFSCNRCGLKFLNKSKLDLHVLTAHIRLNELNQPAGSEWMCEICGCHLSSNSAKKHYLTHSFIDKKYSCQICDMKFPDQISLTKHIKSHSHLRPFSCAICNVTFKRKDHLKKHIKNKHRLLKDEVRYECRNCNSYFTSYSYLVRHQRMHAKGVSYECTLCKSSFPTEHSLKMHQTRCKHDTLENGVTLSLNSADLANKFMCKICNQRYGSINSLKTHKLSHDVNETEARVTEEEKGKLNEDVNFKANKQIETIYQCSVCSKKYVSEIGLRIHKSKTKHGPIKPMVKKKINKKNNAEEDGQFKCNKCDKLFDTILSLKMHKIKRKHFSKCPLCDKQFVLDFKMRNHLIKVHKSIDVDKSSECTLSEMPFECPVCHKKFAMHHNLLAHLKNKHTDSPVSFVYVDPVVFEEKVSSGQNPVIYHCTDCSINFNTEEEFINHTHVSCNSKISNSVENIKSPNKQKQLENQNVDLCNTTVLFQCQECSQHFVTHEEFLIHTHENSSNSQVSDSVGQVSLLVADEEKIQKDNVALNDLYHCQDCLEHFVTKDEFLNHTHECSNILQVPENIVENITLDTDIAAEVQLEQNNSDSISFDTSSFIEIS